MKRNVLNIKYVGYQREYKALDILTKQGNICWRVPMSNLPFDIVCIDIGKKLLRLIEVKSPHSRLSERQRYFKDLIERYGIKEFRYEVMVVE